MLKLEFKDSVTSKYRRIEEFHEGLAGVQNRDGLFGFIDKSGNEVIPCQYKEIGIFREGLVTVRNSKGLCGFIDKSGNEVILCQYKDSQNFHDGIAAVSIAQDEWIFLDKNGNHLFDKKFTRTCDFREGFSVVESPYYEKPESIFIIDTQGNTHGPYSSATCFFNGIAIIYEKNCMYTIDTNFNKLNTIDDTEYSKISINKEKLMVIENRQTQFGYLDRNLNQKIPCIYSSGRGFKENLAIIEIGQDIIGFINPEGKNVLFSKKTQYKEIRDFSEGLAAVKNTQGLWGFINKSGKEVIPCQFEQVDDFSEGLAGVLDTENNLYFINTKGNKKIIFNKIYRSAIELEDKIISIKATSEEELKQKKLQVLSLIKKELLQKVESEIDELAYITTSGYYKSTPTRAKKTQKNNKQTKK